MVVEASVPLVKSDRALLFLLHYQWLLNPLVCHRGSTVWDRWIVPPIFVWMPESGAADIALDAELRFPIGVRAYIGVKTDERTGLWDQISNNNRERQKGRAEVPMGAARRTNHLPQEVGIEPTT
eukprot:COSAG06_NODE_308_length_17789_cov_16.732335_11_plen_124_part_00